MIELNSPFSARFRFRSPTVSAREIPTYAPSSAAQCVENHFRKVIANKNHRKETPNFNLKVFSYPPMGGAFSILWPTKNSKYGDQVNRDFFADEKNESKKISISKSIMTNLPRETCTLISPPKPEGNRFKNFLEFFKNFYELYKK